MSIAQNKKAFFDYFIEDKYEAGIVLEGWEVKAIRDNRVNLKEAYVIIQRGEIYIIGCHVGGDEIFQGRIKRSHICVACPQGIRRIGLETVAGLSTEAGYGN